MRKNLTLLLSILISFSSYAVWYKTGVNADGETDYIDFNSIKKIDEYVYYWILIDYPKPTLWGDLSSVIYIKGDCDLNRIKYLSYIYSKKSMNQGKKELSNPNHPEWKYPSLGSGAKHQLDLICNIFK